MLSLRSILLACLSIASIRCAISEPEPSSRQAELPLDFNFQELLNALPEESIHAALHKHLSGKFQDGTYEHDRVAVEVVRNSDPPTATRVVVEAALDLIKRQSNTTTSSVVVVTTDATTSTSVSLVASSTVIASSSTAAAAIIPVVVSTTNSVGSSVVVTTSAVASVSVSVEVVATTTNSKGSAVTSTTTAAAAIVTASNGEVTTSAVSTFNAAAPHTVSTTGKGGVSVVLTGVTSGATLTATDARGSTFVTTYTPGGGVVQSLVLQTSTLPNGQPTTITSFAVVEAMTSASSAGSATTTSGPKLQNAASALKRDGLVLASAIAAVAAILFF